MANYIDIIGRFQDNFSNGFNSAIQNAERSTANLSNKLSGLTAFLPAQFQGIANGFGDVSSSIGGATSALGPYGIAAGVAIAAGTALFINGIKIEKEFSTLKKTLGNVDEQMRINAKTISGSFDLSLQQVASTTERLSTLFNITDKSGLEILRTGLSKTTAEASDFIDVFNEFSPVFKDMGLNVKESTALVDELLNKGFGQKGADAVKEFGIRFSEMTKAQQDALKGLGPEFAGLSKKVKSGSMTQFEAMKIVSNEISRLGANSNVAKTAVADLFGGPGEDLGMIFFDTMKGINTELDTMPDKIGDISKATMGLTSAWETFKGIFAGGPEGNFFSKVLSGIVDQLTNALKLFTELFSGGNKVAAWADLIMNGILLAFQPLFALIRVFGKATGMKGLEDFTVGGFRKEFGGKSAGGVGKDTYSFVNIPGVDRAAGMYDDTYMKEKALNDEIKRINNEEKKKKNTNIIGGGTTTADKTKSLAETRDIKSLVINIENVVREQYIETNQDPLKVKDMVTRALTAAITDAKLAY